MAWPPTVNKATDIAIAEAVRKRKNQVSKCKKRMQKGELNPFR
jgi:hypothetical protein